CNNRGNAAMRLDPIGSLGCFERGFDQREVFRQRLGIRPEGENLARSGERLPYQLDRCSHSGLRIEMQGQIKYCRLAADSIRNKETLVFRPCKRGLVLRSGSLDRGLRFEEKLADVFTEGLA